METINVNNDHFVELTKGNKTWSNILKNILINQVKEILFQEHIGFGEYPNISKCNCVSETLLKNEHTFINYIDVDDESNSKYFEKYRVSKYEVVNMITWCWWWWWLW